MGYAHQGTVDLDDPANEPTIKWIGRPVVSNTYYIKAGDNYSVLAEKKHWPKTLGKLRAAPDMPGLETVVLTSAIEYEYETCAPPIILEPATYAAPARAPVLDQRTVAPRRALPRRAPRSACRVLRRAPRAACCAAPRRAASRRAPAAPRVHVVFRPRLRSPPPSTKVFDQIGELPGAEIPEMTSTKITEVDGASSRRRPAPPPTST